MRINKILQVGAYITLVAAFILVVSIAFNCLYPYEPMKVECPAKILNVDKTIRSGETIITEIVYDKTIDTSGVVTRQFINDIVYVLPSYVSNYPIGKRTVLSYSTAVPKELPEGDYHIKVTIEYFYPPFRKVYTTFVTEKFHVVK